MRSKTLSSKYFSKTLFTKNLMRYWPLWFFVSFCGAVIPLAAIAQMSRYGWNMSALEMREIYYNVLAYVVPAVSCGYALVVASAVWPYLFQSRSVGMMHALPIRREGLFFTGFLSGMTMIAIPYVVTGALTVLMSLLAGAFEPVGVCVTILGVIGESLFFFALATLACFLTGNAFGMICWYGLLNFLAVGLDLLLHAFASGFLYGVRASYTGSVEWLSPVIFLTNHVSVDSQYVEQMVPGEGGIQSYYTSKLTSVALVDGWLIAVYAAVGLVLLGLAWLLYRVRRSECAGDVVAVGWLKPVFRFGMAFLAAIAGGMLLYALFCDSGDFDSGAHPLPLAICMLVAGLIGYYLTSMLLAKSLKVFRGSIPGAIVMAVFCFALCFGMAGDWLHIGGRVPAASEIRSVELNVEGNTYTLTPERDGALLEQLREMHAAIYAQREAIQNERNRNRSDEMNNDPCDYTSVNLVYTLRSGVKLERFYTSLPITSRMLKQEGTYAYAIDQLLAEPGMRAKRLHQDDPSYSPVGGYLYMETRHESFEFSDREAALIQNALVQDAAEGTWGTVRWFDDDYDSRCAMDMEIRYTRPYGNGVTTDWSNIYVYPDMRHTVDALTELGFIRGQQDLMSYEAYWQFEQENIELWGEDYEFTEHATEHAVPARPAADVGIIGGADGPTQIIVSSAGV